MQNNNFEIKKLTNDFIDDVFYLENKLIGKCDKKSIIDSLTNEKLNYFVLLKNDKVVGFFECLIISPEIELYDICIDEEFQGFGYSKLLMNYLIELAKQFDVATIFLEVNSINNKAINLYSKYGFKQYSIRKNYYGENDAILMKLEL